MPQEVGAEPERSRLRRIGAVRRCVDDEPNPSAEAGPAFADQPHRCYLIASGASSASRTYSSTMKSVSHRNERLRWIRVEALRLPLLQEVHAAASRTQSLAADAGENLTGESRRSGH